MRPYRRDGSCRYSLKLYLENQSSPPIVTPIPVWPRITVSGEVSTVAPAATSGSSRAGLMSCTTSSNPAFTRLSAIGPPILPSPTNPTRSAISFLPIYRDDRSISRLTENPARLARGGQFPAWTCPECRRLFGAHAIAHQRPTAQPSQFRP